jgi:phosphatidylserine decarboxylase
MHLSAAAATGSIDGRVRMDRRDHQSANAANASNLQTWFRRCPPVQKVAMPQGGEASCSPDGPTSRGQHRSIGSDADC